MDNSSIQKLHEDHVAWLSEIKFYIAEIKFLKSLIPVGQSELSPDKNDKTIKYLNHLDHNLRFLIDTKETINTHEMFMKDSFPKDELAVYDENEFSSQHEYVDHEKTKKHMKEFRKRYNKLKSKIFKITEARKN